MARTHAAVVASRPPETVDIAIITILSEEYAAVRKRLKNTRHDPGTQEQPNQYAWTLGEIERADGGSYQAVLAMAGSPGTTSSSLATSKTIVRWKPRYVLLVGIAGGMMREELALGDVVVSSIIRAYEYGKIQEGRFEPRPDFQYKVDGSLLRNALSLSSKPWQKGLRRKPVVATARSKVLTGPVASGDKVVDDVSSDFFAAVAKSFPKLLAVEMEGSGAAAAIEAASEEGHRVGFLMIRGISDMPPAASSNQQGLARARTQRAAGGTQVRDRWKQYASDAAAHFAVYLVENAWPVPPQVTENAGDREPGGQSENEAMRTRDFRDRATEFGELQIDELPANKELGSPTGSGAARTRKASPSGAPRVPHIFMLQAESRQLFEQMIAPWVVTRWEQNAFGINAVVEISGALPGTNNRKETGRLFVVQLKSTEEEAELEVLRATTGDMRYWLNHSLPVLLVSAHLPSHKLRYRWIDDRLLLELRSRAPTFWSQATVTVPMTERLEQSTLPELEAAVARFRARERAIHPARFFLLRQQVLDKAEKLQSLALESGVESVRVVVDQVRLELRASAYMVAIAGPQRVGKSTLLNALLGMDISPVADYPTTAVPLLFEAGEQQSATVLMESGTRTVVQASSDALRPFAAQQENDANGKGVRLVQVTLPNEMLARGVTLVDTPGLHDASPSVREVTKSALENADAVLYVLDASLGAKFKIGQPEVEDLTALQRSKERVLVLLNQADALDDTRRAPLCEYLEKQLKKYGLWDALPVKPLFVSGRDAWDARRKGEAPPAAFRDLEDELWGHLLRNRSTGLHRLTSATARLMDACATTESLLSDRAEKGAESGQIDKARRTCELARKKATNVEEQWQQQSNQEIATYLFAQMRSRADTLSTELENIPAKGTFPTSEILRERLEQEVLTDAREVWAYIQQKISQLAQEQGEIVQRALAESQSALGLPKSVSIVMALPQALPAIDLSLPEAQLGFWGGLLGFLVNPFVGVATTLLGLIIGRDVAIERRRRRAITDIRKRYADAQSAAYHHIITQAHERVLAAGPSLLAQVHGRLETFINDAQRRIQRLGTPLSPDASARLHAVATSVVELRKEVEAVAKDVTYLADASETTTTA